MFMLTAGYYGCMVYIALTLLRTLVTGDAIALAILATATVAGFLLAILAGDV